MARSGSSPGDFSCAVAVAARAGRFVCRSVASLETSSSSHAGARLWNRERETDKSVSTLSFPPSREEVSREEAKPVFIVPSQRLPESVKVHSGHSYSGISQRGNSRW